MNTSVKPRLYRVGKTCQVYSHCGSVLIVGSVNRDELIVVVEHGKKCSVVGLI